MYLIKVNLRDNELFKFLAMLFDVMLNPDRCKYLVADIFYLRLLCICLGKLVNQNGGGGKKEKQSGAVPPMLRHLLIYKDVPTKFEWLV